jgi:Apea-like HEPN
MLDRRSRRRGIPLKVLWQRPIDAKAEGPAVDLESWSRGFLPREWRGREGWALVILYRSVRAPLDKVGVGPLHCDIGEVRVIVFWGAPWVPNSKSEFWFVEPNQMGWNVSHNGEVELLEGRYCLFCAHFSDPESKASARTAIDAARGVLYAYHGRNIAYMKVAEVEVGLATTMMSLSTETAENPFSLPAPRLSPAELSTLAEVTQRIEEADEPDRDRLGLSFRWFASAVHLWGSDAFLHYWIALEALAMPSSTNIKPVNEQLASAYGIPLVQAIAEFRVGRLYGFRCAIVHTGSHRPVPGEVLTYVAALYTDVLLGVLGLPSEQRARGVWRSCGSTVERFLLQRDHT